MKKLLVFVVLLAAGAGAAYHFGYLDRLIPSGLGGARLIPKDAKLLAYFRPDARELLVVQLTELDLRLSGESPWTSTRTRCAARRSTRCASSTTSASRCRSIRPPRAVHADSSCTLRHRCVPPRRSS